MQKRAHAGESRSIHSAIGAGPDGASLEAGGPLSDPPPNAAPQIVLPAAPIEAWIEAPKIFQGLSFSDPDSTTVTVTLTVDKGEFVGLFLGGLIITGDATTRVVTGSALQVSQWIATGGVGFVSDADASDAVISVSIDDGTTIVSGAFEIHVTDFRRGTSGADLLTGTAKDSLLEGWHGEDTIHGADGDDTLNGGHDMDLLDGGGGNDVLIGDHSRDTLLGGDGDDLLYAQEPGWGGGFGVERLEGGAGADTLYGGGSTFAFGDDGNDEIHITEGRATVHGGAGDDHISAVTAAATELFGDDGNDLIQVAGPEVPPLREGPRSIDGGAGDDRVTIIDDKGHDWRVVLGGGADQVLGGAGRDRIEGGAGADQFRGGFGADFFIYRDISDSTWADPDSILDFSIRDRIDLRRIDADVTARGDQAFVLVEAFSGQAGEATLDYDAGRDVTLLMLRVGVPESADYADMLIEIAGIHADPDIML